MLVRLLMEDDPEPLAAAALVAVPVLEAVAGQVADVGRSVTPWPAQRESAKEIVATQVYVSTP